MPYSKFTIAAGALLLMAAGAIAGRANDKKGNATNLYYSKGGICKVLVNCTISTSLFTTGGSGLQMTVSSTTLGTAFKVFSTSGCNSSRAVHLRI